jgi:hypothetical protein
VLHVSINEAECKPIVDHDRLLRSDLLLHSLYDAGQYAERVATKLEIVATALRRQFISYDSAIDWLSRLGLLGYVGRDRFRYEP